MSPAPDPAEVAKLSDADPSVEYVRRILPSGVVANVDTGEPELLPQKAFVFDPDLSIHQTAIIEALKSSVPQEYMMPPNGAVQVPALTLVRAGAQLKHTPHDLEPVLGPAHHSIFGQSLTPSKTDKAAMRDVLVAGCAWVGDAPTPVE